MGRDLRRKDRRPASAKPKGHRRGGWTVESLSVAEAGPGLSVPSLGEALAAMDRLDPSLAWPAMERFVVPLFQRVRPYPPGFPEAVRHVLPSGISVTLGIDTGPSFVHVTAPILEGWKRGLAEVVDQALRNLRARAAAVDPASVIRDSVLDVPLQALQSGTGSASTFVLVPDVLPRLFGGERRLFLAPMRDLLIALPWDVDRDVAAWLFLEFASQDPNCLAPLGFAFADGRISVEGLDRPAAIA